jgi:uncharacterized repeat protein (TIGR01451 family)
LVQSCATATVITQPTDQTVVFGDDAVFTVAADGNPPPSIQWQVSADGGTAFNNVPGETAATLTVKSPTSLQSGNRYRAALTNACGTTYSSPATLTVTKATPSITWGNPADIIYGTALGAAQLNATADVAGTFSYTPASGTVLGAGDGQTISVSFTPTDSANYNGTSAHVSINVLSAVLSVSMTADRNPAPVGLNFNYKPVVTNTGNASATNVVLTDVLPSLVTYTASTTSQGTCSYALATHTVTCNIGTIAPSATVNVQITVKPRNEGTLNNTASMTGGQWDPTTGNNSASVNGLQAVKVVDLSVSQSDAPDPIFVGDNTVYTMLVKNNSTVVAATGVVLTDSLPSSMTFVSATTTQGSLVIPPAGSTGVVMANIGSLAAGASATVTVTVKSTASGVITNTASVSDNETDANGANNTSGASTTVKDAALQKVLLAKQVLTGGCENTTGNVYLTGPAGPGGVTVSLASNVTGASVPTSVFINAGQSVSPTFPVTTNPVIAKQTGLVTATSGPSSVSRGVTINIGNGTCQ